jgi:hypothetical protein
VSISAELRQQVSGAIELSSEARRDVEEAAGLVDSVVARLTALLAASNDATAAQAVRLFAQAHERLEEITGLLFWAERELPVFLDRLGQAPTVAARDQEPPDTSFKNRKAKVGSVPRAVRPDRPEPEAKTYTAWWGNKSREILDEGAAESAVSEAANRILTGGARGIAIRIGDGELETAPLRIDIDTHAGRAAVSWHGSPGVEPGIDPDKPLLVGDDPEAPPVTVPAARARVSPGTAIAAAREYVSTGRRPTCLTWGEGSPPPQES